MPEGVSAAVFCKVCGGFIYHGKGQGHTCPPCWDIWEVEEGDEGEEGREYADKMYGRDAGEAVERWAQQEDARGDYDIVGGSPATVHVAEVGSAEVATWVVEGRSVPEYTATKQR